jgi:Na+-translocating ferredoxin:NAD+ oxidoreductase RnfC subunit
MNSTLHQKVREAGVIGAGGAGFPTHIKLSGSYDCVIANGAECEPLLQCDQEVMTSCADRLVEGMEITMRATGAGRGIIALKKKHKRVIPVLKKAISHADAKLALFELGNFYPAGDEQVLVYEVLGRIVPEGGRPGDVGCLVQNVQTLVQIADASLGRPVVDRILSVHGAVKSAKILRVAIGTPVKNILRACGGLTTDRCVVLSGGIMMGRLIDMDCHIGKTTSGLYFLPSDHPVVRMKSTPIDRALHLAEFVCEQCSFCTSFCPRYLLGHDLFPNRIMQAVGWGVSTTADVVTGAYLCCECGLCGELFACPLMLSPDRYNGVLKKELAGKGVQPPPLRRIERVREDREGRRISVEYLIARLGLEQYDVPARFESFRLITDRVRIDIAEHVGKPAVPVVAVGDHVEPGDVIARTPAGEPGATYHASIPGAVTAIDGNSIQINS